MTKTVLLWQIKQKILYHDKKAICLLAALWAVIFLLFVSALLNKEEKVRIFLDDQDHSGLAQAFLRMASEKISLEPRETAEALAGIRSYQAELLLVIPAGAEERLLAGETEGIFGLYYLKDNALAVLLADRLISSALAEVYRLRGEYLAGELYRKYAVSQLLEPTDLLAEFRCKVKAMHQKMQPGYYFSVFDEWPPETAGTDRPEFGQALGSGQVSSDLKSKTAANTTTAKPAGYLEANQGRNAGQSADKAVRAWVILMIAGGVNFVFLLYFGLKLLYLRDKNDKMKAAGFEPSHQLLSDLGVLLWPEGLLVAALGTVSYALAGLTLWLGLTVLAAAAIGFNLLFIRVVKEKQMYFPIGIGVYILTALVGIALFLQ